jgi:hypothetical protein
MRVKLSIIVLSFFIVTGLQAQQFTMKGGVIYSQFVIPKHENPAGSVSGLTNYYYEANYSQRFGKRKYWTIGFGYLGAGGTIYGSNLAQFDENGITYVVDTRLSNLIFPIKFKFSTEHKSHPRYYCYAGVAPAWMFDEARSLEYHYIDEVTEWIHQNEPKKLKSDRELKPKIFPYHAQKLQGYIMTGGGVYYKHILLDFAFMVNTFHVYEEFLAPVSLSYGAIATLGVQVSRPINKYSCHSFF